MALDRCCALRHGRETFPFTSDFLCLFFDRFLKKNNTFVCHPPRPITEVWMCMWGYMMPKRGLPEFPTRIYHEALSLRASEDDHAFVTLVFLYARIDWRGCPNIFFTTFEP